MSQELPRAVRNANPGNIRKTGIQWLGLSKLQNDPDFCVFISAIYGFRALALDLHTKRYKDGLLTIREIITKYAPPSENDTQGYINVVCDITKYKVDDTLDLNSPEVLGRLSYAISFHESGGWFFKQSDLHEGVKLALEATKITTSPLVA